MAKGTRFAALAHGAKPTPAPPADADPGQAMLPMAAPQVQRSRVGKRALTVYLPPELVKAVRLLAVESDRTAEDMTAEALNDLLRKHGKHPVL